MNAEAEVVRWLRIRYPLASDETRQSLIDIFRAAVSAEHRATLEQAARFLGSVKCSSDAEYHTVKDCQSAILSLK